MSIHDSIHSSASSAISSFEQEEKDSLDFIHKNIESLTGYSSLESYRSAENAYFQQKKIVRTKSSPLNSATKAFQSRIKKMPPDGDCLLHAFNQGAALPDNTVALRKELVAAIDLFDPILKGEAYDYFQGVTFVFDEQKDSKDAVLEAFKLNITQQTLSKGQRELLKKYLGIYKTKLGTPQTWLGQIGILTLHRLKRFNIEIYDAHGNLNREASCTNPLFSKTIKMMFNNNHYDLVQ
jgi:hypothetical protein